VNQNLTSLERLRLVASGSTSSDDRLLEALLAACSDAIQKWCARDFALREYDELYDGTRSEQLLLRQYPVQAVASVRGGPYVVLEITNTTAEQARAAVTRTGLELVRVSSGTRTVDTSVTWASNVTFSAVASAITALGNGWQGRTASGYEAFPSQDLFVPPPDDADRSAGALACAGNWAGFRLHVREMADYLWSPRGWLERSHGVQPLPWWPRVWEGGPQAWRVQYTAGYPTVPEAVQLACCLWAGELFAVARRDPGLASQSLVGQVAQSFLPPAAEPPPRVQALLSPFRTRRI
jgi:hypothetical protein